MRVDRDIKDRDLAAYLQKADEADLRARLLDAREEDGIAYAIDTAIAEGVDASRRPLSELIAELEAEETGHGLDDRQHRSV